MGSFGFSFVGLFCLILLFLPNIKWARASKVPPAQRKEPPLLVWMERIGQAGIVACSLLFRDYDSVLFRPRIVLLGCAVALLVCYNLWWRRVFRSGLTQEALYSSFLGIPLAGAVLPSVSFLFLGVYGGVVWLILASTIFGVGHISIARLHQKSL